MGECYTWVLFYLYHFHHSSPPPPCPSHSLLNSSSLIIILAYIHMHTYTYMYIHTCVHMCVYVHICVYICIFIYVIICTCICIMHICMHMHISMYAMIIREEGFGVEPTYSYVLTAWHLITCPGLADFPFLSYLISLRQLTRWVRMALSSSLTHARRIADCRCEPSCPVCAVLVTSPSSCNARQALHQRSYNPSPADRL